MLDLIEGAAVTSTERINFPRIIGGSRAFPRSRAIPCGLIWYPESATGDFENRFEHTFGNEFRFLLWPTTTLVGEYRLGIQDYLTNSARDSTTHFLPGRVRSQFQPAF